MIDEDLARHARALRSVAATPIRPGNGVTLLPEAMVAIEAMFDAIAGARHSIVLEYYTFENVEAGGRSLLGMLSERLAAGVRVAIIYDAIGSDHGQPGLFAALGRAGAHIVEYHGLNPLRRFFSIDIDHRDHRKILVVDDRVAFLGGVNMDRQYMNPPSAGIPPDGDTRRAFWQDAAIRIEGPVVGDTRAIFDATWRAQDGDPFPPPGDPPPPMPDGEHVCVEGTAPREGSLHTRAVLAAIDASRSEIALSTGYFVPMPDEVVALRYAARRGVSVRLIVPGVSDVSGAVHAGRATYGRLLRAGVRVHEAHHAVLHAKIAVIDGVWSSVGSSNFDRRSARLNNEADAIVLGRRTAAAVRTMMAGWFAAGRDVTLREWTERPLREHFGELTALVWSRLM
jgi:cardiolipin synthase